jgi:hypothetical protein
VNEVKAVSPVASAQLRSPNRGERSAMGDRRGFALEATLVFMVLLAALVGASLAGVVIVRRTAGVDYRGSRVDYAAEAGADHVMSQLDVAMQDGVLTDAEIAAITPPSLPGFSVTVSGARVGAATPRTVTSGPYAGLFGLNQRIDLSVTARDSLSHRSDVVVGVNAQSIPLFQFGVFYQDDLEILNGPPMVFAGWVHTNGNLYVTSSNLAFQDIITTPGNVYWQRKDHDDRLNGVTINNAAGVPVQLDFDSRSDPTPAAFVAKSQAKFDNRLMTGASGVTSLRLPLPVGMSALQLIQPRNAGDTQQLIDAKMAWKADFHLTVDLAAGGGACGGMITVLPRPGGRAVPAGPDCPAIFTWVPNAFVDGREDIGADLLDIDVGALQNWIAADPANRQTDILYVTFVNSNTADPVRDYPSVRLRNGAQLLAPFTLATDRPLYVWGHYNSNPNWFPAGLMADAVTFLSNEWTDAGHAAFAYTANATEMWVYAAIAAGNSATPCDWQVAGCVVTAPPPLAVNPPYNNYGGGLENFPRFLENWGGSAAGRLLHYRGSLVCLFESQYAARYRWSWRTYYNPPQRDWQFEIRFRDPTRLPPGTPAAGSVTQIAFRPVY